MGTRGRRSSEDVAPIRPPTDVPDGLTEEQQALWARIVGQHGYFNDDQLPLLESFVRHSTTVGRLGQLIDAMETAKEMDIDAYDRLLRMRERESRVVASFGVRLGIAQKVSPNGPNKPQAKPKAPWQ